MGMARRRSVRRCSGRAERPVTSHPQPTRSSALPGALLDYYQAPGRYQLRLRQPALLFSSIPEVLQLASRPAGGDVREAARFFIRAAMLFPGADHYAVFGLETRSEPVQLKERYRLLMRLIHPDYAGGEWPTDAAIRVNQAYEVLSSAVLRRTYDEQLAAAKPARALPERKPVAPRAAPSRHGLRRLAFGAAGVAFVAGGFLLLAPDSEPRRLVQRKPAPAPRVDAPAPAPVAVAAIAPAAPLPPVAAAPAASGGSDEVAPAAVAAPLPAPAPAPAPAPTRAPAPLAAPASAQPPAATAPSRPQPPPLATLPRLVPATPLPAAAAPPRVAGSAAAPPTDDVAPAPPAAALPARVAQPAASTVALAPPRPAPAPVLSEVQPVLSQMLEALEGGRGEGLLALLEPSARTLPAALALSRQYEDVVGIGRPVRVAHGEFRSEARGGVLQVTGMFRLHVGEPTIGSQGEPFQIRAEFTARGGRIQLTGLSGAAD